MNLVDLNVNLRAPAFLFQVPLVLNDRVPQPDPSLAAHVVRSLELGPVHWEVAPVRSGDVAFARNKTVPSVHFCAVNLKYFNISESQCRYISMAEKLRPPADSEERRFYLVQFGKHLS